MTWPSRERVQSYWEQETDAVEVQGKDRKEAAFSKLFFTSKSECGKIFPWDESVFPRLLSRTCVCCSTSVCFTIMKWPIVKLNISMETSRSRSQAFLQQLTAATVKVTTDEQLRESLTHSQFPMFVWSYSKLMQYIKKVNNETMWLKQPQQTQDYKKGT